MIQKDEYDLPDYAAGNGSVRKIPRGYSGWQELYPAYALDAQAVLQQLYPRWHSVMGLV